MPKMIDIRKYPGARLGLIGARKNLGLTQQELADKVPLARSVITELERGKRDTSSSTWLKLKEILMVGSVEEIWETFNYIKGSFVGSEGRVIEDKQNPKRKKI